MPTLPATPTPTIAISAVAIRRSPGVMSSDSTTPTATTQPMRRNSRVRLTSSACRASAALDSVVGPARVALVASARPDRAAPRRARSCSLPRALADQRVGALAQLRIELAGERDLQRTHELVAGRESIVGILRERERE